MDDIKIIVFDVYFQKFSFGIMNFFNKKLEYKIITKIKTSTLLAMTTVLSSDWINDTTSSLVNSCCFHYST